MYNSSKSVPFPLEVSVAKKKARKAQDPDKYADLKKMLRVRQWEILNEVQEKIRGIRSEGQEVDHKVPDTGEVNEIDIQEDIEFALIQMKAETLNKINEALASLEERTYGKCRGCGYQIPEPRLMALPFATRCKDCQETHDDRIIARGNRAFA